MNQLVTVFFCIGALDFLIGGRLKMGEAFERGFGALPNLFITMTGFMTLAPWLSEVAAPVVGPMMRAIGADPSFFAAMVISCDSGGAVLAKAMADDPAAGLYNGLILAGFLGTTITFTIPYSVFNASKENRSAVIRGLMVGFVSIPIGGFLSGLIAGIPMGIVVANTIPAVVMAVLLVILFKVSPEKTAVLFQGLMFVVRAISLFGACVLVLKEFVGLEIVSPIAPASETFSVIATIAFYLAGILTFVKLLQMVLNEPIKKFGKILDIDARGVVGIFTSMCNSMGVIFDIKNYEPRSAMLNVAFLVPGCFAIGDFLAFALQFAPEAAIPQMIGKLITAFGALAAAAVWGTGEEKKA